MPLRNRYFALFIAFILYASAGFTSPPKLTPIKLQLKWQHQFQFAGYYAAIQQGYYQKVGLKVELIEALPGVDPVKEVLAGHAQFGVGTSELVLNYYQGDPVMVLGVIMQHSPLALVTLASSKINNIHQLANKQVMIEPNSAEIFAYLKNEGIKTSQLHLQEHSHQAQDLINGKVDAMTVYTTDETFDFDQLGIAYQLYRPIMSGIDFYGDNFFTTQQFFKNQPNLVENFRKATIEGWQYAMAHPQAIIQLIQQNYSNRKTETHLRYEAEKMRALMKPTLVEPGYMNPGRWQHIVHTYHQLGLLPEKFNIEDMLYTANGELAYQALKQKFYYSLGGFFVFVVLAAIFYRQYHLANLRRKQFETLFLNAPISLIEIDHRGMIENWNLEAENTFQHKAEEVMGQNVYELLVPKNDISNIDHLITSAWQSNQIITSINKNIRKDGQELLCHWANLPFETEDKNRKRVICMARDITQEKAMEEQLYKAAHYDDLTGLPNRTLVLSLLKEAIADAKRHGMQLALMFVDLDDFKAINDTFGHLAGDKVLKQLAERIQHSLRESDLVGRLSGDEFLVVIKDLNGTEHLEQLRSKILDAIQMPIIVENKTLEMHASIGTSLYPKDTQDIQQLIQIADQSMYKIKAAFKSKQNTH